MTTKKFTPLKFGRHGRVSIYRMRTRSGVREYANFAVSYYHCGRQFRKSFASLNDAKDHAAAVVVKMANGEIEVVTLDAAQASAYKKALKLVAPYDASLQHAAENFATAHSILAPTGVPLLSAVDQFAEAHRKISPTGASLLSAADQFAEASEILDGFSLTEAARIVAKINCSTNGRVTVKQVAGEMLLARKVDGVRARHLAVLRAMIDRIVAAFGETRIGAIEEPAIKKFLNDLSFKGREVTARTRNNYRLTFGQLFKFAQFQKYLSRDHASVDHITEYKDFPKPTLIYDPAEIAMLLAVATESKTYRDLVPFFAIGAFAGLRHAEITRLDWKQVSLADRHIVVLAENAKTAARRIVPISDNLAQWLADFRRDFGPVCKRRNVNTGVFRMLDLCGLKQRGFQWKRNALRHSFCSYRLAAINNAAQVALEAGNSVPMIHAHYKALCTADAAQAWFGVVPPAPSNVIQLALFPDAAMTIINKPGTIAAPVERFQGGMKL